MIPKMLILLSIIILMIYNVDSYYYKYNRKYTMKMISSNSNSDSDNSNIIFGGVKFSPPLSNHLKRLGITSALPIQESAIR